MVKVLRKVYVMKWWETEIAQFILFHISIAIAGMTLIFQTEFWIGISSLYIILGALYYFVSNKFKNEELYGLRDRVASLESYKEWLEEELKKARNE